MTEQETIKEAKELLTRLLGFTPEDAPDHEEVIVALQDRIARVVALLSKQPCETCKGSGEVPAKIPIRKRPVECSKCDGWGWIPHIDFSYSEACPKCNTIPCPKCKGTGKQPPPTAQAGELKCTLHNKNHKIVGHFRLKDGWIQFATQNEPDKWAWPCSFKWNHHHCTLLDQSEAELDALRGATHGDSSIAIIEQLEAVLEHQADETQRLGDQITDMQVEKQELEAEKEWLRGQADGYCAEYVKLKAENKRLKDKISKMRY